MADPLSIAVSIAGLVSVSAKIVSMLKDLYDCGVQVKQAPESINHLMEEMQDMNVIFCQIQLFILGATKTPCHSRLKMLSIHHLIATLSGCVLISSNLDKYLSEVVGISYPSNRQFPANKASPLFERIKWALWKEAEVTVFIQDLQRHKLSLSLMLGIIQCNSTTEAFESLGKLHDAVGQILESNLAISVQLREFISRHDPTVSNEIESSAVDIQPTVAGILPAKDVFKIPVPTDKDDGIPDNNDDAASIRSTASSHSTLSLQSMRLVLPSFTDELKNSRPYKRIRNWCVSDDSFSTSSRSSSTRGCSWSMLSKMSLGDLSISEISVIELPICLSDLWDSQPYQVQVPLPSAADRRRIRRKLGLKWFSRGRIHRAILEGNENVVRDLLNLGLDIEEKDLKGRTPLAYAAYLCHESICKLLLERGASVEGIIHSAIFEGNEDAVRVLIALGTDIEIKDSKGRTPLAYAAYKCREDICKLLLERGASVEAIVSITSNSAINLTGSIHIAVEQGSETVVRLLLAMGADIEDRSEWGMTPLLRALYRGEIAIARFLIEKGADIFARDVHQWTAVHCAARGDEPEMLTEILERGARKLINECSVLGYTPLHFSTHSLTLTKLLIEHGASPHIKAKKGNTPYRIALRDGDYDVAKYLWSQLSPEEQTVETPPPEELSALFL